MGARTHFLRLPVWFRFTLLTLAVFVCGVVLSRPPGAGDQTPPTGDVAQAARAVDALAHPSPAHDPRQDLPRDFAKEQNRDPKTVIAPDKTLRVADDGGGCSGPAGDTEWDFSVACRAHDLGYDLLRYAEHKGQPLGQDARRALDDRLTDDLHTQCELNPRGAATTCHAVAFAYAQGLKFNSWRQRWGPPGHEPAVAWAFGCAVVVFLLLARTSHRRREQPTAPLPVVQDRYATFLRIASLGLLVVSETIATVAHWTGFDASWLWALQVVPIFFFAGGHANLLSWQEHRGGFGCYVSSRISWLLRPVLAFVLLWVVLFAALNLLDVQVDAYSRLITHPLWFLGVYILAVCATPLMAWLHRNRRLTTPAVLAAATFGVEIARACLEWRTGGYVTLLLGALLMQQYGFFYADGSLDRISKRTLAVVTGVTIPAFALLVHYGGHPRSVIVLGLGQICLALLVRGPVTRWLDGRSWRVVQFARTAPMTIYLAYLAVLGVVVALLGFVKAPVALVLTLVPLLLVFHRFETQHARFPKLSHESHRTRLATALGAVYGVLGVLGFVVTGFLGDEATLVVFPVDPLQNVIHLLLGWYLIHIARTGTCHKRLPWLLTALACVPPLLVLEPTALIVVPHAATIAIALLASIPRPPARTPATTPAAATPTPDDLVASSAPAL
ncbi:phospholipase [Lentzea sp. NBRC 105346]|nr:phospholipase A2 [Lentzea sp. NBRC 105346]GLZ29951.1 phospholipase [Lentzea sp. NBRC 105346]